MHAFACLFKLTSTKWKVTAQRTQKVGKIGINPRRVHIGSQPTAMCDHGFMGIDQLMPQKAMKNHSVAF